MLSAKLVDDEYEMRYYKLFNATMLYESLKSIWQEMIAVHIAAIRNNVDEAFVERTEFLEYLSADENICKENANKVLDIIEPVLRNYLEIPKNIVIPIDENRLASDSFNALQSEVANLEMKLRNQKLYTYLLHQRLQEIERAENIAERVTTLYVDLSEKIINKKETLNKLEALSDMAKSGEDVSERLLSIEKEVKSNIM